jgi:hypothetical protein
MLDMDGNVVKRRLLRIYVSESARNEEEIIGKTDNKQLSQFKFIMVNGVAFDPIVVDTNGAIRYSIQLRSKRIGMIPLANGHFLYEDKTANRMSKSGEFRPCRYHEMDYLGRVYRTFLLDFQVLGIAAQKDELLYLNVQDEEDTEKEQVIALNLSNGEIIRDAVLPDEEDSFQGKLCRPLKKNAKNRKQGGILSADGTRMLSCADYRGERKKGKKACLMETDTSNGQVLNRMVLQRAVSLIWKFEPDMLSFCVPAEKKEDVIFGTLLPPERFDGTLPPLEEKAIERIYFSGVRLCDDLFICYILPGRIDKIYFIGENNKYVQDYVGMRVKNAKVSFVISMADFAVDEYCVYVESRNAVHRLKNIIRVVE